MFLNYNGIYGSTQSPLKPGLGQGRATSQGLPSPPRLDIVKGTGARLDHREKAGSDPVTFFGAKKDIPILRSYRHKLFAYKAR